MSTSIKRHPDAATLMGFAAGSLGEPLSAVVAAHVSVCARCRSELKDMELIGATLLLSGVAAGGGPTVRASVPAHGTSSARKTAGSAAGGDKLPRPIAQAYGLTFDSIPWRRLGPGVWHHRLALTEGEEGDLRLLKIAAGRSMPDHGHGGAELTLVLEGAYSDETGEYGPGDVQDVDGETEHRPIADEAMGCICLIASERPAHFKGLVGRLLQPWTRM